MNQYPLQQLLDIRKRREDAAVKDLQNARQATETATRERDSAELQLRQYRELRQELEQQKYAEVLGQLVSRNRLDVLFADLGDIAEQEIAYQQDLLESENRLTQRTEELDRALDAYRSAYLDREKIVEHRRRWMAVEALVEERALDIELEDFRQKTSEILEG